MQCIIQNGNFVYGTKGIKRRNLGTLRVLHSGFTITGGSPPDIRYTSLLGVKNLRSGQKFGAKIIEIKVPE